MLLWNSKLAALATGEGLVSQKMWQSAGGCTIMKRQPLLYGVVDFDSAHLCLVGCLLLKKDFIGLSVNEGINVAIFRNSGGTEIAQAWESTILQSVVSHGCARAKAIAQNATLSLWHGSWQLFPLHGCVWLFCSARVTSMESKNSCCFRL